MKNVIRVPPGRVLVWKFKRIARNELNIHVFVRMEKKGITEKRLKRGRTLNSFFSSVKSIIKYYNKHILMVKYAKRLRSSSLSSSAALERLLVVFENEKFLQNSTRRHSSTQSR